MVARAHCHYPALSLGVGQRQQLVERAPLLEGSGELQVLELEVELAAGEARQRPARQERRERHRAFDARRRSADGLERNHWREMLKVYYCPPHGNRAWKSIVALHGSSRAAIRPMRSSGCWSRASPSTRSICSTRAGG